MQEKKLIAFDLYDTCFHFTVPHIAYQEIFSVLNNRDIQRSLKNQLLTTREDIGDILSTRLPQRKIDKYLENYHYHVRSELASVQLFLETTAVLSELKHRWYKLGAVSNLSPPYIEPLEKLLPHTFDYEIFSCDVGVKKPDKKIFECLETLSWCNHDEIVMIGDSIISDLQWAKNAGISPIRINRKSFWIARHTDHISISTLEQLLDILH